MNSNVTILERFFDKLLAQNCRVKCIKLKVKKKKKNEYLKFFPIIFLPTILSKKFHAPTYNIVIQSLSTTLFPILSSSSNKSNPRLIEI